MRSKNTDFWKIIDKVMQKKNNDEQLIFLQKIAALVDQLSDAQMKQFKLYREGLKQDINEILAGSFIAELSYRDPMSLEELYNNMQENEKKISSQGFVFRRNFDLGEQHPGVVVLQRILTQEGLYQGILDGLFDQEVKDAVYQFQLRYAILYKRDNPGLRGLVGPATRQVLNQFLR